MNDTEQTTRALKLKEIAAIFHSLRLKGDAEIVLSFTDREGWSHSFQIERISQVDVHSEVFVELQGIGVIIDRNWRLHEHRKNYH